MDLMAYLEVRGYGGGFSHTPMAAPFLILGTWVCGLHPGLSIVIHPQGRGE